MSVFHIQNFKQKLSTVGLYLFKLRRATDILFKHIAQMKFLGEIRTGMFTVTPSVLNILLTTNWVILLTQLSSIQWHLEHILSGLLFITIAEVKECVYWFTIPPLMTYYHEVIQQMYLN